MGPYSLKVLEQNPCLPPASCSYNPWLVAVSRAPLSASITIGLLPYMLCLNFSLLITSVVLDLGPILIQHDFILT